MTREQLEHVIRAAGAVTDENELVVVGSQAILASFPGAHPELLQSREADIYPRHAPEKSIVIDGSIGEVSYFDTTFGYYAHGVSPETATLPPGWETRAVVVQNENTRMVRALCLHPLDLAVSKLIASRSKDLDFVEAMLHHKLVEPEPLTALLQTISDQQKKTAGERALRIVASRGERRS